MENCVAGQNAGRLHVGEAPGVFGAARGDGRLRGLHGDPVQLAPQHTLPLPGP